MCHLGTFLEGSPIHQEQLEPPQLSGQAYSARSAASMHGRHPGHIESHRERFELDTCMTWVNELCKYVYDITSVWHYYVTVSISKRCFTLSEIMLQPLLPPTSHEPSGMPQAGCQPSKVTSSQSNRVRVWQHWP